MSFTPGDFANDGSGGGGGGGSRGPDGITAYSLAAGPDLDGSLVITYTRPQRVIAFSSAKPSPLVGDTYTPAFTKSGTAALVTSIPAASAAVCSLSGGTVTFLSPGICTLRAEQSGDDQVAAATIEQLITVRAVPAITPRATRRGTTITTRLAAPKAGVISVTATALVRTNRGKTKTVAACTRATATVTSARTVALTCRLSSAVKAARSYGKATVRLVVTFSPVGAQKQSKRLTVTVPKG
ncbi:unannotated protein [freshwater metagenome]|uniref:Unannotated protein n=1 Tax=freshwater metagenome TaxID=449393 RepID=A0A6J7I984_9ZZZZ|nr:hypothetical protein [Actinomycetota bacterium]